MSPIQRMCDGCGQSVLVLDEEARLCPSCVNKKSGLTPKQLRAINRYVKDNGLRLALSNPPTMKFVGIDGKVEAHIDEIMAEYNSKMREDARMRRLKSRRA